MDFFTHQDRARGKTRLLVVYFVLAVLLIALAIYGVLAALLLNLGEGELRPEDHAAGLLATLVGTVAIVTVGSLYKTAVLSAGGHVVAEMLGGRLIDPGTTDLAERRVLNVVEEMAIAAGMPVPPVYLLAGEEGINAFAAGLSPGEAVIGVTRGCAERLSRDELQGVMAHEFSHILNGDMRLNVRLIGILHGILLISIIGWYIFRLSARSTARMHFSKKKEGGNPLPLIGLAVYVIGYVGVIFGNLIKAAISRQREFLADALAVQFTRNPQGIAGALKKIGALAAGSRLVSDNAEEASHMFFGNALRSSWLGLMATHPPLAERIRRIDPSFDGRFEPAAPPPRPAVAAPSTRRPALAPTAVSALDGGQAVEHVGHVRPEHIAYAGQILAVLPEGLKAAVGEPYGACAVVYALLLSDDSQTRQRQRDALETLAEPSLASAAEQLRAQVAALPPQARLPLVELALPSLRRLSPGQYQHFSRAVAALAAADQRINVFEFALERMLLKHLSAFFERVPPRRIGYYSLAGVERALAAVLSVLARAGHADESEAARAFDLAARQLRDRKLSLAMLPPERATLKALDEALDQLAAGSPAVKRRVVAACADCIGSDGKVTACEAELLRAVADSLDCPMPPIADLAS